MFLAEVNIKLSICGHKPKEITLFTQIEGHNNLWLQDLENKIATKLKDLLENNATFDTNYSPNGYKLKKKLLIFKVRNSS